MKTAEIGTHIDQAAELLKSGQLVAIPTETVYGLAGNALDEKAILEIFKVKNRPKFDPLIAHTNHLDKVSDYLEEIPKQARKLAEAYWPGPLTILLKKKKTFPDLLTSGLPEVAIRIPNHPLTLELLSKLDFPLAAPSANPFGYVSPTTARHVAQQLGAHIPYILDGGSCTIGIESTIVGFDENEEPIVYRLGGMRLEDIEQVTGSVSVNLNRSSNPKAPGMLKSHYAPNKRLIIGDVKQLVVANQHHNTGIITFSEKLINFDPSKQIILSPQGSLDEAASQLFAALRRMDEIDVDLIITEKFPDEGLGKAINDRLKRASTG